LLFFATNLRVFTTKSTPHRLPGGKNRQNPSSFAPYRRSHQLEPVVSHPQVLTGINFGEPPLNWFARGMDVAQN
jgi:hypothetical protein